MRWCLPRSCRTQWGAATAQPHPAPRVRVARSDDLYSFPFQKNTSFNTGPDKGHPDIIVQLVNPIHIGEVWSIITRTILPFVLGEPYVPVGANRAVRRRPKTPFLAFLSPKDTQQRLAVEYRTGGREVAR